MKLSTNEKAVYAIFLLVLIMVNPPIVNIVSDYAKTHPFVLGWPTLLVWLNAWYIIALIDFLVGVLTIRSWKKDYNEEGTL
ncbi:hypothetical protein C818_02421 [Lachnospiraceae bacterium MD308]|jgi:hypothetical protein|nr:hypothetical protein C818_02421 [Lachnospiraceae bacterium MD308]MCI8504432.1 hypothetical protein [Dorea sp.]